MGKNEDLILIDCDVIIHFFQAGEIIRLHKIFPGRLRILDIVFDELSKKKSYKTQIENLLNFGIIQLMLFPSDAKIIKEYSDLRKVRGRGIGESACMAVARHLNYAIASSNLKDIKDYCTMHNITYYTTMDFLCEALNNKIFTKTECDYFISAVLGSDGRLPCKTMDEFLKKINGKKVLSL